MVAVKAHFDGYVFVPESPVDAEINQPAIITILDNETADEIKKQRFLSFAGSISHEDLLEMEKALEDTEQVFPVRMT
ncbi:MAG: hypothetical protein LBL28_01975 [Treponema sp.]|jgi:hypothetical protein|nr:hypothetical protein [Treponema sp.]